MTKEIINNDIDLREAAAIEAAQFLYEDGIEIGSSLLDLIESFQEDAEEEITW